MLASNYTQSAERVSVRASYVCTFSPVGCIRQLSICIEWRQASTHDRVVVKASCTYLAHHELESVIIIITITHINVKIIIHINHYYYSMPPFAGTSQPG